MGAVIGGVAVIARGVPRFTADIDVAVVPPVGGVDDLLRRLSAFGFEPRIDGVQRFAEENLVILARHGRTDVDIDLSLAQLPFEQEAISEAEWVRFGRTQVLVPRATALVIYKMVAARPKDLADVEALIVGRADIDTAAVERNLKEFDALLDLGRADEWRRLFTRVSDVAGG